MGVCITCVRPDLRELLVQETGEERFASLPPCPDGAAVGFGRGRGGGGKRAPSEYNIFMGKCIKARPPGTPVPEAMKGCAIQYKQLKGKA